MTPADILARQLGYNNYAHYLQSDYWIMFRNKIIHKTCGCCNINSHLQLHHITYERLGQELPNDVITVCGNCYIAIHILVKTGVALGQAHIIQRRNISEDMRARNHYKQWVSWFKLINKSKHQTLAELRVFLIEHGLSDGEKATEKAYHLHLVQIIGGKERWNRQNYINFMHRARKRDKTNLARASQAFDESWENDIE